MQFPVAALLAMELLVMDQSKPVVVRVLAEDVPDKVEEAEVGVLVLDSSPRLGDPQTLVRGARLEAGAAADSRVLNSRLECSPRVPAPDASPQGAAESRAHALPQVPA